MDPVPRPAPVIARSTADPVASAVAWISHRGIRVVRWSPAGAEPSPTPPDHPILYLVEEGDPPPFCSELEDWARAPFDVDELHARADRLHLRAREVGAQRTFVDDDGTLRVGSELVIVSRQEAAVLRLLVDRLGEMVARDDLVAHLWPDGPPSDPRALDNRVKTLRQRLGGTPLVLHTVRGRGLLLDRVPERVSA